MIDTHRADPIMIEEHIMSATISLNSSKGQSHDIIQFESKMGSLEIPYRIRCDRLMDFATAQYRAGVGRNQWQSDQCVLYYGISHWSLSYLLLKRVASNALGVGEDDRTWKGDHRRRRQRRLPYNHLRHSIGRTMHSTLDFESIVFHVIQHFRCITIACNWYHGIMLNTEKWNK